MNLKQRAAARERRRRRAWWRKYGPMFRKLLNLYSKSWVHGDGMGVLSRDELEKAVADALYNVLIPEELYPLQDEMNRRLNAQIDTVYIPGLVSPGAGEVYGGEDDD